MLFWGGPFYRNNAARFHSQAPRFGGKKKNMQLAGSEEWDDIVPVPQDDGPEPVVPIAYPPRCTPAYLCGWFVTRGGAT